MAIFVNVLTKTVRTVCT